MSVDNPQTRSSSACRAVRLPLSQLRATFRVVWVVKDLVKAQDVRERRNMEQGVDQRWTRGAWPPDKGPAGEPVPLRQHYLLRDHACAAPDRGPLQPNSTQPHPLCLVCAAGPRMSKLAVFLVSDESRPTHACLELRSRTSISTSSRLRTCTESRTKTVVWLKTLVM